jgi:hypothetical protein
MTIVVDGKLYLAGKVDQNGGKTHRLFRQGLYFLEGLDLPVVVRKGDAGCGELHFISFVLVFVCASFIRIGEVSSHVNSSRTFPPDSGFDPTKGNQWRTQNSQSP